MKTAQTKVKIGTLEKAVYHIEVLIKINNVKRKLNTYTQNITLNFLPYSVAAWDETWEDDSAPARFEVSKLPREQSLCWLLALRRQPDHFEPTPEA